MNHIQEFLVQKHIRELFSYVLFYYYKISHKDKILRYVGLCLSIKLLSLFNLGLALNLMSKLINNIREVCQIRDLITENL